MFQFSIVIPTWNNLPHLQLCMESLKRNSHFKNQIIIYVNEGNDGTVEWLKTQTEVDFIHSKKNVGVCIAMNSCRLLVKSDYLVYMNDDMYACPNWDLELFKEIEKIGHDHFMLSTTLIEPYVSSNPHITSVVKDFGDRIENFKEQELLESIQSLGKEDWSGASWPVSVVSIRLWDIVGGYSIEFSPGMYSDPDFSMKLWQFGVRIFKGIGSSKVYHFQSKSTKRLKKNKGSDTFLTKWGITANTFYTYYLKMGSAYRGPLEDVHLPVTIELKNKIKRIFRSF